MSNIAQPLLISLVPSISSVSRLCLLEARGCLPGVLRRGIQPVLDTSPPPPPPPPPEGGGRRHRLPPYAHLGRLDWALPQAAHAKDVEERGAHVVGQALLGGCCCCCCCSSRWLLLCHDPRPCRLEALVEEAVAQAVGPRKNNKVIGFVISRPTTWNLRGEHWLLARDLKGLLARFHL